MVWLPRERVDVVNDAVVPITVPPVHAVLDDGLSRHSNVLPGDDEDPVNATDVPSSWLDPESGAVIDATGGGGTVPTVIISPATVEPAPFCAVRLRVIVEPGVALKGIVTATPGAGGVAQFFVPDPVQDASAGLAEALHVPSVSPVTVHVTFVVPPGRTVFGLATTETVGARMRGAEHAAFVPPPVPLHVQS